MTDNIQQRAEKIVRNEVKCCVTQLVETLAGDPKQDKVGPLFNLSSKAIELTCPIPDYEDAAIQNGAEYDPDKDVVYNGVGGDHPERSEWYTFEGYCKDNGIDPMDDDIYLKPYEYWTVSLWLARELRDKGEKVDMNFAGLCVWARTTTGQAIHMDDVILLIAQDLSE